VKFLPVERGSRYERLETPADRGTEKLDLRTPKVTAALAR